MQDFSFFALRFSLLRRSQFGCGSFFQPGVVIRLARADLVLAVSGNSPFLLGRRLWDETRVALFQQSLDTRRVTATDVAKGLQAQGFQGHQAAQAVADQVDLGVSRDASAEEIKRAFRRAARMDDEVRVTGGGVCGWRYSSGAGWRRCRTSVRCTALWRAWPSTI